MSSRMIVKVQRSIYTDKVYEQMLVYDAGNHILFQGNMSEGVRNYMIQCGNTWKAFFYARLEADGWSRGGKVVVLEEPAPMQEW